MIRSFHTITVKRMFGLVAVTMLLGTQLLPAGSAEATGPGSRAVSGTPVTTAPAWRLSITGSTVWGAPVLTASSESITIMVNGGSEAGPGLPMLNTVSWTRPNMTGTLTPIGTLLKSHVITAQRLGPGGTVLSTVTYYCVRFDSYYANGTPIPQSQIQYITGGVEHWSFNALTYPPPANAVC